MLWVYTSGIIATMQNIHPCGNFPIVDNPRHPMGQPINIPKPYPPITFGKSIFCPCPTSGILVDLKPPIQSLFWRSPWSFSSFVTVLPIIATVGFSSHLDVSAWHFNTPIRPRLFSLHGTKAAAFQHNQLPTSSPQQSFRLAPDTPPHNR